MRLIIIISFLSLFLFANAFQQKKPSKKQIEKGKTLYKFCVNCHGITKGVAADPLQKIRQVRTKDWIYKMIQNPAKFIYENPKAKAVFKKRGYIMESFPELSKAEIEAILDYLDSLPFDPKNYTFRKSN